MTLIAEDGYEYENLDAQARQEPVENERNRQVTRLLDAGYPQEEVKAWCTGFDNGRRGSVPERFDAAWRRLNRARAEFNSASRTRLSNPVPPAPAGVHPAD